jgi:hypothetical protein
MTSVFIVRPFGKKRVTTTEDGAEQSVEVDFDVVDRTLFQPVLERNGMAGERPGSSPRPATSGSTCSRC